MKPTGKLRWLEVELESQPFGQKTVFIAGTSRPMVLQQEFAECFSFDMGFVPDGKREWRDVVVELANR